MTLIECFDREPVRNIAGCLELKPEKLIFLGEMEQMQAGVARYRAFLARRGIGTQVTAKQVPMDDPARIKASLKEILETEKTCVIDVTGGGETLLLAVGAVLAELGREVPVRTSDMEAASLTVQDVIFLHGGVVHPQSQQPSESDTLDMLQPLWELASRDPRSWNRQIGILKEFESRSESRTEIELYISELRNSVSDFEEKETVVRELLDELNNQGVIRDNSSFGKISYSYISPMLHDCVKKAGNLLEMKTLLEARSLREDGAPYFDDCLMSVTIDWDGELHNPADKVAETRNEIDVLLTRGMIPLFISCKNGSVGEEELYKLNTVADRFGGPYARKMLIASRLDQGSQMANRAFIQRARDMGVYLVTDADGLTHAQWHNALREAMK